VKTIHRAVVLGLCSLPIAGCSSSGELSLGEVLDVANVALNTAIAVDNIRNGGSSGGYVPASSNSGGSQSSAGTGGSSDFCPQVRANYHNCRTSWINIGGGSTGQAGSFQQCMKTYQNAAIAGGCSL
jgi:hypothetical protein